MAAATAPAQQKVILHGVSWETCRRLLSEHQETSGTHFLYDGGDLEIMVLSARHETPNRVLALLVELVAAELDIELLPLGSTTFQREDLQKGFEADSAFYVAHAADVAGREVDPALDPPPDLIIEVDVTSPSLNRFPVFAAFGAPEVWRYDGTRVAFCTLRGGRYMEARSSSGLPPLTAEIATQFLQERRTTKNTQWMRRVREWARAQQ